jgi:acetyl-CoA carboxylase biotin carboxyl carrier protein
MTPEDTQELKELIEFLKENNIGDFELERGDLKVRIKFAQQASSSPDLAQIAQMVRLLSTQQPTAPAVPSEAQTATQGLSSAVPAAASAVPQSDAGEDASLHMVKSPIVGTFYESPSPGSPPFVKIGDHVENGQILCIIEAMKLMNEIECDVAGEIVKRFAQSGQPVEYGQQLFAVRPR